MAQTSHDTAPVSSFVERHADTAVGNMVYLTKWMFAGLAESGHTSINKAKLRSFYGVKKLNKTFYRDFLHNLPKGVDLNNIRILDASDDVFIFDVSKATSFADAVEDTSEVH